jgi:hypothetical protein
MATPTQVKAPFLNDELVLLQKIVRMGHLYTVAIGAELFAVALITPLNVLFR